MIRKLTALLALALLSACILVDDFGTAWEKAKPDACLSKIAGSLYYAAFNRDPSQLNIDDLARGWSIGRQHFLLLKKSPGDKGGRLYKFDVVQGVPSSILNRYRLNPAMRKAFEEAYPHAPVSLKHDTVMLRTLGADETRLLAEIAARPEYWEVEDKVMYNTMHNPACRFEPVTEEKPKKEKQK